MSLSAFGGSIPPPCMNVMKMASVKVLIEGYARQIGGGWIASSTVTLIESEGKKIIIDPGCNRNNLLAALKKENLLTGQVDFVVLTHSHTDHTLLAGIFENAKVLNPVEIYNSDNQVSFEENIFGPDVKIIQTPGHCMEHCSVAVKTKQGLVLVAGDLFWWVDSEEQVVDVNKVDDAHPLETNMPVLVSSRKQMLKLADYIIPGHGKMFRVVKN